MSNKKNTLNIKNSGEKLTPFGGIIPIMKKMKECGLPQVIHSCLGKRVKQAKYSYEEAIIAWVLTALCGGTRLDHITKIKGKLEILPKLKLPSNDTLGRVMKMLATDMATQVVATHKKNKSLVYTYYNNNLKMNRMLIRATKQLGGLKEGCLYTLHVDATFIETNSVGAVMSYDKSKNGYNPMVCLINDMPVFISMRSGNSGASFQITECVQQCIDILAENKIRVGKVISDGAGYNKNLIEMLDARGIKFNIHAPNNANFKGMLRKIDDCNDWKTIEVETGHGFRRCQVSDIPYAMHGSEKEHRLIVARVPNNKSKNFYKNFEEKENRELIEKKMKLLGDKKLLKLENKTYKLGKWKKYKDYRLKLIYTNDRTKSPRDLILEYNQRGLAERQFDSMKNNFSWRLPPFSSMTANTVFMIVAALANNVFRSMLMTFKHKIPQLKRTFRFPEFKKVFIDVVCMYLRRKFMFYGSNVDYQLIM